MFVSKDENLITMSVRKFKAYWPNSGPLSRNAAIHMVRSCLSEHYAGRIWPTGSVFILRLLAVMVRLEQCNEKY